MFILLSVRYERCDPVSKIDIPSDEAQWMGNEIACYSPEALEAALTTLREVGYEVEDRRLDARLLERFATTPEAMERVGAALWHARLKNIRYGKCGSCQQYISTQGIESHGHTCETCGEVTYLYLPKGATVRFQFVRVPYRVLDRQLVMDVIHWDRENGWLYLEPEMVELAGLMVAYGDIAADYLNEHLDKWELTEYEGQAAMKVRYFGSGHERYSENGIELYGSSGEYKNFSIVRIWDGVEYSEYGQDFPLPPSLYLYELWRQTVAVTD